MHTIKSRTEKIVSVLIQTFQEDHHVSIKYFVFIKYFLFNIPHLLTWPIFIMWTRRDVHGCRQLTLWIVPYTTCSAIVLMTFNMPLLHVALDKSK